MRVSIATLAVAALITSLIVAPSEATSTLIDVRIEGKGETLFEGPVLSEGHDVQASSDSRERSCDGIDPLDPQNTVPGPTPTAASVDAMAIVGETFDGQWYPGYGDYFITRWGTDSEEAGMSWGILVNNVFTDVGGCQYELTTGNEVLWAYNAFAGKPFLALLPVDDDYTTGARPLTTTAELGKPFSVEVISYGDGSEHVPPGSPERAGSAPFEGAEVSPVSTSAKGFEKLEAESPETVVTGAQGKASIIFTEPGWHRIKASAFNSEGKEDAIRSNRLDVCVPAAGESACGAPPAEDSVRTPPISEVESHPGEESKPHTAEVTTTAPTPFHSNATTNKALPLGPLAGAGTLLSLHDDRWSAIHYLGAWRRLSLDGAWQGTVSRGKAGARLLVRLQKGRPVFLLRATSQTARVQLQVGSRRQVFTIAVGEMATLREIVAMERSRAGRVNLRVLKGTVDLDGVAVRS